MRSVRGYAYDCCSAAKLRIETEFDTPRENQVGLAIFGTGEVDTTRRRIRYGLCAYGFSGLEPILIRIVSF